MHAFSPAWFITGIIVGISLCIVSTVAYFVWVEEATKRPGIPTFRTPRTPKRKK